MIIIISEKNYQDWPELTKTAGFIQKRDNRHKKIIDITELTDTSFDRHEELIILGHGYIDNINGYDPKRLADVISRLINAWQETYRFAIHQITLFSCNTGIKDNLGKCFAQRFGNELSTRIQINSSIKIIAPNGWLIFYPSGESVVLAHAYPGLSESCYLETIKAIDSTSPNVCQQLAPYIESQAFVQFGAINSRLLNNRQLSIQIIEEDSSEIVPHVKHFASGLLMSCKTYNWFTERFAEQEQKESPTSSPR
jgi:hypothetical protein